MGNSSSKRIEAQNPSGLPYLRNLLEFCGWKLRGQVGFLSRRWASIVITEHHMEWLCWRLSVENRLYVSPRKPADISWRGLFQDLWQYRDTWKEEAGAIVGASSAASSSFSMEDRLMDPSTSEAKTFIERLEAASKRLAENPVLRRPPTPIKVHVRFRPPTNRHDKADGSKNEAKEIVLPLHQKLRLLKAQKAGGKALTSKQALERLTKAGGWFGSRWTEEERVKAGWSLDKEAASAQEEKVVAHVHTIDPGTGRVVMVAPGVGLRGFTFDSVMGQKVSQRHVFDCAARRHIIDFMNGFNATLVMYGQTGSGKTHTMFGPDVSEEDAKSTYVSTQRRISNERGIVPRAVEEIFGAIEDRKIQGIEARVYVSYVEIFGHEVFDLLRGGAPVANSKVAASLYVLKGERQVEVRDLAGMTATLRKGDEQKRKAATAMNERSTRAHSVLILSLNQRDATGTKKLESKFFFADLGGSEQIKKSKVSGRNQDVAEGVGYVMGTRMREAVFINTGLLALKQCIKDLNEGKAYVSYQNHKLTKLLSSGLGGDAKSAVIVCCSSDDGDAVETIQALRFGEKCAKVSNDADINQAAMSDMLAAIDKEMDALEKAIQEKEHWVRNEQVETDRVIDDRVVEWKVGDRAEFRAGEGGWAKGTVSGFDADGRPQVRPDVAGAAHVAAADNIITADELRPIRVETVVAKSVRSAFKLTGAEAERKRLEELIKKRFQLTGEKVDLKLATTGFGGMYGGTVDKTGADKSGRYAKKSRKGLLIKGKKVAEWQN